MTECSSCGTKNDKTNPEDVCGMCAYPLFPTPELIKKYEKEMELENLDDYERYDEVIRKQIEEKDRIEREESDKDGSENDLDTEEN